MKMFLFFTAAVAGAAVMIVEILGANMLSPYVGTSHFVWSAQIAVTLISLAVGYYAGGWLADHSKNLSPVYIGLIIASASLVVPAAYRDSVVLWFWSLPLAWATLLASFTLFFPPLTLLAAVGPFLVRFLPGSVDGIGRQVGAVIAVGTLGSLFGTLAISYVMIPLLSQTVSLIITAAALLVLALSYFMLFEKQGRQKAFLAALASVFILGAGIYGVGKTAQGYRIVDEVFRRETHYGLVQVLESRRDGWRVLLTDYLVQNQYNTRTGKSMSDPPYILQSLVDNYIGRSGDALCIGLGAGILPRELNREGIRTSVVEINPEMVAVARRYFDFDPSGIDLHTDDARHFLQADDKRYGAIVLDAFLNDGSLFHLMTREAFTSIRGRLHSDGVLVINTLGDVAPEDDFLTASLFLTLRAVFPSVRMFATPDGAGGIYFVAGHRPLTALSDLPKMSDVHPGCRKRVGEVLRSDTPPRADRGILLTDNFNPAPFRDAPRREALRRHFFAQARSL
jgi:spermidine synthase